MTTELFYNNLLLIYFLKQEKGFYEFNCSHLKSLW